jgi:catechol 2,3-dioxygenase-like lactoylglutathione lyase family enzyme
LIAAVVTHRNIEVRLFNPFATLGWRGLESVVEFARLNRRMHNNGVTFMTTPNEPRLVGLNHIDIEVGSIDEALDFYSKLFAFELRSRGPGMAFIDLGDQFLALQETQDPSPTGGRHFGLVVEDREAARKVITDAGYGEYFVHRTGHGIGVDLHEDPYIREGNSELLEEGMTFSIEPGIYLPGRFGVRIEDIAIVTKNGSENINLSPHGVEYVR